MYPQGYTGMLQGGLCSKDECIHERQLRFFFIQVYQVVSPVGLHWESNMVLTYS